MSDTLPEACDFLLPKGELARSYFAESELAEIHAKLDEYIAAGNDAAALAGATGTTLYGMTVAWTYKAAYTALEADLITEPVSGTLADQGSITFGASGSARAKLIGAKREKWEAVYNDLLASLTPTEVVAREERVTHAVPNVFGW